MNEELKKRYERAGIPREVLAFAEPVLEAIEPRLAAADAAAELGQLKVLEAMRAERVAADHLGESTGYGYDDAGRDTFERVFARVFGAEKALVRAQIASGTHALAICLFGMLRPGDVMLAISGKPYDTLDEVIGIVPATGSLAEYEIGYAQADLTPEGGFDFDRISMELRDPSVKLVHIQRSRGYAHRPSLTVAQIAEAAAFVHEHRPDVPVMVDNCYGEFVEEKEPTEVGADLIVGSLIKNPGGGLAPTGGYIAGRADLVDKCAYRLTAPGLGGELGASLGVNRPFYQGLFLAPTVTAAALKGALFASALYAKLGYGASPGPLEPRTDVIQSVDLNTPGALCAFCRGIQAAAPVDSFVEPIPWDMPGYQDPVIMAAGAFISGSSIELSADGPMRVPYTVFFQGGLTWPHAKAGILRSLAELAAAGEVRLPPPEFS
ncbi:MAG: methionine gamma-lyase family protein [Lachnospiraceae bacterium]|nr:methionine gamma-lyase family protein [Lachnospiraceae bacterium]